MHTETERNSKLIRRQRSARRLRHEAQVKVFEVRAGGLEDIRSELGLRPSQICEILKVHPSAWTRWTRAGKAPPHIYQMLDWYMELLKWRGQHNPAPWNAAVDLPLGLSGKYSVNPLVQQDPEIYVKKDVKGTDGLASQSSTELTSGIEPSGKAGFLGTLKTPLLTWILVGMWGLQTILWGIIITLLLRKT